MNELQFELDQEMVELIPAMNTAEYEALKTDITNRVQAVGEDRALSQNIILGPDGKCIDGRTRLTAMAVLGLTVPTDKITMLPYGTTRDEVIMEVKSANARRNLSKTQKATVAYRSYLASHINPKTGKKLTKRDAAKQYGIGYTTLNNLSLIHKLKPEWEEALWAGKAIEIENKEGDSITTTAINSISIYVARWAEDNIVRVKEISDHEHKFGEGNIHTQRGKDWYKEITDKHKLPLEVKLHLEEMANMKFSYGTKEEV